MRDLLRSDGVGEKIGGLDRLVTLSSIMSHGCPAADGIGQLAPEEVQRRPWFMGLGLVRAVSAERVDRVVTSIKR